MIGGVSSRVRYEGFGAGDPGPEMKHLRGPALRYLNYGGSERMEIDGGSGTDRN
jgi:hypothetical protein